MPETLPYWDINILHINMLGRRFDYKKTWSKRRPKLIAQIKTLKPDVVTGVECQVTEAKEIAAGTGYGFKNYLGSTIFYRKGLKVNVIKEYSWLKNYPQSAIVAEVTNSAGQTVNIAASHLPPFVNRTSLRKREQKELCELFNGWSDASIICTDANWRSTFESYVATLGWKSARLKADKKYMAYYKTSSPLLSQLFKPGSPIDYVIGKAGKESQISILYYRTLDGRVWYGDHNGLQVIARCGKISVPTT